MWDRISKAGNVLTKVETYWSLGALVTGTGAFNWLVGQWELVASQGGAGVLIVSIFLTSVVMIAGTCVYWAAHTVRTGRARKLEQQAERGVDVELPSEQSAVDTNPRSARRE